MTSPDFEPGELLAVLVRHGVRFVLIGGLAALAHGSPFPTEDVDITPDTEPGNLSRLSAALTELDARIRSDSPGRGAGLQSTTRRLWPVSPR